MNKRGQFFLIGAVVIVGMLIGFSTIYNSSSINKEDKQPEYLAEEILLESSNTINYALHNNLEQDDINRLVENLTYSFSFLNPTAEIVIIYGEETDINSQLYKNENNLVSVSSISINSNNTGFSLSYSNNTYSFKLKKGQNIHTIIKKEVNDETIIYSK